MHIQTITAACIFFATFLRQTLSEPDNCTGRKYNVLNLIRHCQSY